MLNQPAAESLVQRMNAELGARAVLVIHENGQVLCRDGWVSEGDYPAMAALISAMIATGKSLGGIGESFPGNPTRFHCESDVSGLYTVAVSPGIWLAVLYEQPLNPGLFRMKVRRYAGLLASLGLSRPSEFEVTKRSEFSGDTMAPATGDVSAPRENFTVPDSSLFANITDEEIDEIFDNVRS